MNENKRDMLVMALKLLCQNFGRLSKETDGNILSVWERGMIDDPKLTGITSVQIGDKEHFIELFGDKPYKFSEDGVYIYLIEDGVQFYALVED